MNRIRNDYIRGTAQVIWFGAEVRDLRSRFFFYVLTRYGKDKCREEMLGTSGAGC